MRRALTLLATAVACVALFRYPTSTAGPLDDRDHPLTVPGAPDPDYARSWSFPAARPAARTVIDPDGDGDNDTGNGSGGDVATTYLGQVVDTNRGPLQVAISVDGGVITQVYVLRRPQGDYLDRRINGWAVPELVEQTLAHQNAHVDTISGATVTCTAYANSLQSAIDAARL